MSVSMMSAQFSPCEPAVAPAGIFSLYDLLIDAICPPDARILCGATPGDHFFLEGEMLHMGEGTRSFSIYSLAALLPLLPAKQCLTHPHDWMSTGTEMACPDPFCGSCLRITRIAKRDFSHGVVSGVPLRRDDLLV